MSSLKEITFVSTISSVAKRAFKNCVNLEKINGSINTSVLINEIFAGDKSLKDFSFLPPQFKAMKNVFEGTSYELKKDFEISEILLEGDCYKRFNDNHSMMYADLPIVVRGFVPHLSEILNKFSAEEVTFKCDGAIPDECFKNCVSLKRIIVDGKLKSIGRQAFAGCKCLEQIQTRFEETLDINDGAFYGCTKLAVNPFVETATSIGENAFAFNDLITEIRLRRNLSYVGVGAFFGCKNITSLTIPILVGKDHRFLGALFNAGQDRKELKTNAFKLFNFKNYDSSWIPTALKSVCFTGGVVSDEIFAGLPIKELDCSFVTEVGPKTFIGCSSVETLKFGEALKVVDGEALLPLIKLQDVIFTSKNSLFSSDKYGLYVKNENGLGMKLLCYYGALSNVYNVLSIVESIGKYAFVSKSFDCFQFTSSIKEVDTGAFFDCAFRNLSLNQEHYGLIAFDSCIINNLEVGNLNVFTNQIFKFKTCSQLLLNSLIIKKWVGEDILGLLGVFNDNAICINELRIGVAAINSAEKMDYLKKLAVHTTINHVITNTPLDDSIVYENVVIPASAVDTDDLLGDINDFNSLVIQKANHSISPNRYFKCNRIKIKSLSIADSIDKNGLNGLIIDVLRLNDDTALIGLENWGETCIETIEIMFDVNIEMIFTLLHKAKKLFVNGKEINSNTPLIQNGILYHYFYKNETCIRIDSSVCTVVAKDAFADVIELNELVVGQGVMLEPGAFPNLRRLNKLTIDSDINLPISTLLLVSSYRSIRNLTITGEIICEGFCKNLSDLSLVVMNTVKKIGDFAFSGLIVEKVNSVYAIENSF